jgi:hypothetical protein
MHKKLIVIVGLLSACGVDDSESWLQGAIVNGKQHYGHKSVVQLRHGSSLCTATLIGYKTALTAAHCVKPGETHYLVVDGFWHQLASTKRHEAYSTYSHANDVALVFLGASIGVTPSRVSTLPPSVGQTITMIGYGKTGEDVKDSGIKRIASTTLSSKTSTRLKYFNKDLGNICNGDSGGPSFATIDGQEVQVGVHSLKYGKCGDGGADMRVDVYKDWIVKHSNGDTLLGPTKPTPPTPEPAPTPSPKPGDADGDGIPDAEDLCSNTPAGAKVWTQGEWKGCASGQTKDPTPPPTPPTPPKPDPTPEPKPDPKPDPNPTKPDADGDGIPDVEDRCDKTPSKWHSAVHQSGDYKGCYPNGDVITN